MQNQHLPPDPNSRDYRPAPGELVPRQFIEAPEYVAATEESDGLLHYWQVVRRHKALLIVAAVLGGLAGLLLTLPEIPVYQAKVSIEVQGLNENFLNLRDLSPTSSNSYFPEYDMQTQVKVLESRMLAERVVRRLKAANRGVLNTEPDRFAAWRKALHLEPPKKLTQEEAVGMASIRVKPVMNARIIEVFCDSIDPKLAAQYANTMAEEYITDSMESRWRATQNTGEWLTRQIEDLKIKLEKSEDQLQAYSQATGLLFTGDKDKENVNEEKLRQLQQELLRAQTDRIAKQSKYELAKSIPVESLPEVLDDETVRTTQGKLTDLRRQMAELSATLTPAHYKVQRLQAQITELEASFKTDLRNILTRIANEFEAALRREKLLAADYETQRSLVVDQASKVAHYNILKREVDTNRQLYDSMLQRVKETGVAAAMKASGIRVIDPAVPPLAPYKPNLNRSILTGCFAGMFLGVILVFLRERADRSLQQPGDAPFYLNVPELGVIPSAASDRRKRVRARQAAAPGLVLEEGASPRMDQDRVELITWARKPSMLSEAFRTTLTSFLFSGRNGDHPHLVVLTSANPSEGKTTVTVNLAIALAEISQRVLVIDADMRRPRVHEILELGAGPGLAELLREKEPLNGQPLDKYIRPTQIPGLSAMRSGRSGGTVSNLLHSPRLPELLERLRKEYDSVLIDTPPVLHISDARVLGRLADAVILVLKAGKTTRDSLLMAKQRFLEDGTPLMGTILNHWNPKQGGYNYKHYDGYYYPYRSKSIAPDE
jgi:capsular exopolysaccharide synthesis family protein